ncbi:MAG: Nramp family divalent metal transporter [bacterium]|nr:divalent metal cation transporter [Gammaproteobacteria bacterium]HIL99312.1 divalent metal cation transporter [Pseudomonadales bacterium]
MADQISPLESIDGDSSVDPYTVKSGGVLTPPLTLLRRLKYLGPSVIVSGSIVGSGEIILTSSLGAAAGFSLLWWVLMSCWIKSLVQAELARYTIVTGDTYLRALNRLPGKLWGPKGKVGWPIWLVLLAFIPGIMGLGGIMGGAGQALSLLFPVIDSRVAAMLVALTTIGILNFGGYQRFEKILLGLVIVFTTTTLICAITMQFTEFSISWSDIGSGFTFDLPVEYIGLALAVYGYTGVNSGETAAYTYWCIEKGYPTFIGPRRDDEPEYAAWLARARGWIKVLHMDVWLTLIILTCATLPFYLLGAGVLHTLGETPDGLDTISILSGMFTRTLGNWALWVFGIGAFFILFSTTLSAIGAGGRFLPDYFIELGFFSRKNLKTRLAFIRGYVTVAPLLGCGLYMGVQNPVTLVTIGGLVAALMLPIQSGGTLWLQRKHMDQRLTPHPFARTMLWLIFLFQLLMSMLVIQYVVF